MITYSFYLRNPKDKESLLYLALRTGKEKTRISTGITDLSEAWDKKAQLFSRLSEYHRLHNEILLKWKSCAAIVAREAVLNKEGLQSVKLKILEEMGIKKNKRSETTGLFLPYFQKWATTSTTKRTANRMSLYTYRQFAEYAEEKSLADVTFSDINYALSEDYIEWMDKKGLSANTRGEHVKNIKTVMHEAYKRGVHKNEDFRLFRKETEEVDNVYLTEGEICRIEKLELTGTRQVVRDLFIIGCYTAMRFSDYSRLSALDIVDGFIRQTQQKTNERVVIPLHPKVKEIIDRWEGVPRISQQKLNSHIKDICKEAEIFEIISIVKIVKGAKTIIRKEKWEMVSSHTARRTAATNMFKAGIPSISIMKITGHRTEANFLKYIKLTKEENAEMLAGNVFFRG